MDKRKVLAGAVCVLSLVGGCVYYSNAQKQKDMEPPVLSADAEKFSASIKADEKKLISGVTAFDQKDGDVSDSILIDSIKKKEGTDSDFLITYVAFDKSSNMASLTRTLHYSDYRQAHFSFEQALRFPEIRRLICCLILRRTTVLTGMSHHLLLWMVIRRSWKESRRRGFMSARSV